MKKLNVSEKHLREFGLLVGIIFPVFIGWLIPAMNGHIFRTWTLCVGIPFFILGIIKPSILIIPYKSWMKLGNVLGWINSHIILGLVFLLILQPIALIMKITGYDPLKKNKNIYKKSYREIRKLNRIDLRKIF